eukprot:9917212-Ditylum_brightwellii.AAC.1
MSATAPNGNGTLTYQDPIDVNSDSDSSEFVNSMCEEGFMPEQVKQTFHTFQKVADKECVGTVDELSNDG